MDYTRGPFKKKKATFTVKYAKIQYIARENRNNILTSWMFCRANRKKILWRGRGGGQK